MAVVSGNSNEEKSRARGLLDKVASCRFVSWLLDLHSVITNVSKRDKLTILEIPTVTDDCIDKFSDLIEQGGEY